MVKKWVLKAIVQKVISYVPFSFRINYLFQRYITKRVVLTEEFLLTMIGHFREIEQYWMSNGKTIKDMRIVELGTGWHPVIPLLYHLCGARSVITIDLRSLLRSENLKDLIRLLSEMHANGHLDGLPIIAERLQAQQSLLVSDASASAMLESIQIKVWVGDARSLDLPDGSAEGVSSINVLEHVDETQIVPILEELCRLTVPKGLHYHAIGTYDHFVHIDPTISKFNYLKYSQKTWKRIDNRIQPQNRLRLSWFRDCLEELGLEVKHILLWDAEPDELAKIVVHPDFVNAPWVDIPYGTFIAEKM